MRRGRRWALGLCILGLLAAIAAFLYAAKKQSDREYERSPVRSLWLSLERSATRSFLDEFERFARLEEATLARSAVSPDGRTFSVEMRSPEFRILSASEGDLHAVYFYRITGGAARTADADAFVRKFRDRFANVPGVSYPNRPGRPTPMDEERKQAK